MDKLEFRKQILEKAPLIVRYMFIHMHPDIVVQWLVMGSVLSDELQDCRQLQIAERLKDEERATERKHGEYLPEVPETIRQHCVC